MRRLAVALLLALPLLAAPPAQAAIDPTVLYVHGYIASAGCPGINTATQAAPLKQTLTANGYTGTLVPIDWLCGDKGGANIKPYGTVPVTSYNATLSIATIADTLAAWVRATQTGPVACVGHSMGGLICSYMAKHHPDLPLVAGVTYSTPYQGWDKITPGTMGVYCGTYLQCQQMTTGSAFLTSLAALPRPPAATWTCLGGSPKDNVASIASACGTDATTRVDYYATGVVNYSHTSYLTDTSQLLNVTAKVNGLVTSGVGHSLRMAVQALRTP